MRLILKSHVKLESVVRWARTESQERGKHPSKVSIMTYFMMFKGGLHGAHSGEDNLGGGRQV